MERGELLKSNELKFELEMELLMWALLVQATKVQTERTRQRKVERGKLLKSNELRTAWNHQLALVALVLQEQGRLQERTLRPQLLMGPHPWTRAGYEIALFVPRLPLVLCAKKIKLLKEKQWPEGLSRMPQKTTTAS